MVAAFLAGSVTTPLYALFLAYKNDALSTGDMPAALGGLVLTFGMGAILGLMVTGWAIQRVDPYALWLVLGTTFAATALYALYRISRRASLPTGETESYQGVIHTTSPVAVEAAAGRAADQGGSNHDDGARS